MSSSSALPSPIIPPSTTISSIIKPTMDKSNEKNKQVLVGDEDEVNVRSKDSLDLNLPIKDSNRETSLKLIKLSYPNVNPNRSSSGLSSSANLNYYRRAYFCRHCKKKFGSSQALGGHQNSHKHEKEFEKREQRQMDLMHNIGFPYNKFPPFMYSRMPSYSTYHNSYLNKGVRPSTSTRSSPTNPYPWFLRERSKWSSGVSRMSNSLSSQTSSSARYAPYYRATRMTTNSGIGINGMQLHKPIMPKLNNFSHFNAAPSSSATISNIYNINLTTNINRAGFLSLDGNCVEPRAVEGEHVESREEELDLTLKL